MRGETKSSMQLVCGNLEELLGLDYAQTWNVCRLIPFVWLPLPGIIEFRIPFPCTIEEVSARSTAGWVPPARIWLPKDGLHDMMMWWMFCSRKSEIQVLLSTATGKTYSSDAVPNAQTQPKSSSTLSVISIVAGAYSSHCLSTG